MRPNTRTVALAIAALLVGGAYAPAHAAVKEAGVYTKDQAAAGYKEYEARCSRCHGANMEGVSAPALRGEASGLKGDTVGQALTFVSTQMPAGDPGSLTMAQYDEIVAYILARNGHPSGPSALTPASAKKSTAKL